jgi:hypothetical protein
MLHASFANIRLGSKGMSGTSSLAYREHSLITNVITFYNIAPSCQFYETFFSSCLNLPTNNLECWSVASIKSQFKYLQARPRAYPRGTPVIPTLRCAQT